MVVDGGRYRLFMMSEGQIIPFETSPLPPGPWLVFAPHADDEAFGMGGSLVRAAREGIEARVVMLTDGALGGQAADLVRQRRREAEAAAEHLGVKELIFWQEPDRGLRPSERLIANVTALIEETRPRSVFFPGPMEFHPDHRAATLLLWRALGRLADRGGLGDISVFSYEISVQGPINTLLDISAVAEKKWQALASYTSQIQENNYIQIIRSLNKARTYTLGPSVTYAEGFYHYAGAELEQELHKLLGKKIEKMLRSSDEE